MNAITNLTQFEEAVVSGHRPVIAEFLAENCGPCSLQDALVDGASLELFGNVDTARINITDRPELAERFAIRTVPTVLVFKDGDITARFPGLTDRGTIAAAAHR